LHLVGIASSDLDAGQNRTTRGRGIRQAGWQLGMRASDVASANASWSGVTPDAALLLVSF